MCTHFLTSSFDFKICFLSVYTQHTSRQVQVQINVVESFLIIEALSKETTFGTGG